MNGVWCFIYMWCIVLGASFTCGVLFMVCHLHELCCVVHGASSTCGVLFNVCHLHMVCCDPSDSVQELPAPDHPGESG